MVAPVSPAALIISPTTPDGPAALPNFILKMAFFTISMVIVIGGSSSSGSFRIPLKFLIERSIIVFKPHFVIWILVILKEHPLILICFFPYFKSFH